MESWSVCPSMPYASSYNRQAVNSNAKFFSIWWCKIPLSHPCLLQSKHKSYLEFRNKKWLCVRLRFFDGPHSFMKSILHDIQISSPIISLHLFLTAKISDLTIRANSWFFSLSENKLMCKKMVHAYATYTNRPVM